MEAPGTVPTGTGTRQVEVRLGRVSAGFSRRGTVSYRFNRQQEAGDMDLAKAPWWKGHWEDLNPKGLKLLR